MSHVTHDSSRVKKTVYYTSKDWNLTEYENYPVVCATHCHLQATGYRYVTPPGKFNKSGFQCFGCKQKAPDDIIVIWKLINWDKLEWSGIQ